METHSTLGLNNTMHNLYKTEEKITDFRLYIGDFEHENGELDEIFNDLRQATPSDTLTIEIASPGGFVSELQKFENLINTTFFENTTTILNPYGYSCGALLFTFGDERLVYVNSTAMFHDVSLGFAGKHSDVKEQAQFDEKAMANYLKPRLISYFTKQELEQFFNGKEFWMDCYELCRRGIATKVLMGQTQINASYFVKLCESVDEFNNFSKQYKNKHIKPIELNYIKSKHDELGITLQKVNSSESKETKTTKTTKKVAPKKTKINKEKENSEG